MACPFFPPHFHHVPISYLHDLRRRKLQVLQFFLLAITVLQGPFGSAQTPSTLHESITLESTSRQHNTNEGQSVAAAGNLIVTGTPRSCIGGAVTGAARIYDATTGALLH